jgi:hypothetical protein
LAVGATALAACGGHDRSATGPSPAGAARPSSRPDALRLSPYRISLPASTSGPTTCTVYETDYATQIVVDSPSLNVRAECELWAANQPGVGYLWGYERAAATADVIRLCTLTDPNRRMTASVIEDTGFVAVSAAQRQKGGSACAAIVASGWSSTALPRRQLGSPARSSAGARRERARPHASASSAGCVRSLGRCATAPGSARA